MKKILVTGASGFIGNYVINELLKNNFHVIASSSITEHSSNFSWYEKVDYVSFNLNDFNESLNYYDFFGRPDAVIHLAWQGLPNYKSLFHFEDNLPKQYFFLKNLVSNGLKDLTVAGTCFEYGMQQGCLNEIMAAMPANPYALAKDTLRKFLEELAKTQPFLLKWVRLFYMHGEGQNPNSLLSQIDRALKNGDLVFNMSGGEQVRDYLPVEKVAEYIGQIATQNKVAGIINCCSGQPVTVKELVTKYLEKRKQYISLNFGHYKYPDYEPMNFWGDNSKLLTIINNE